MSSPMTFKAIDEFFEHKVPNAVVYGATVQRSHLVREFIGSLSGSPIDMMTGVRLLECFSDSLRFFGERVAKDDTMAEYAQWTLDYLDRYHLSRTGQELRKNVVHAVSSGNLLLVKVLTDRLFRYRSKSVDCRPLAGEKEWGGLSGICLEIALSLNHRGMVDHFLGLGACPLQKNAWTKALHRQHAHFLPSLFAVMDKEKMDEKFKRNSPFESWVEAAACEEPCKEPHPALDFLLEKGFNPNEKGFRGLTAMGVAEFLGRPDLARMIGQSKSRLAAKVLIEATQSAIAVSRPTRRI